MKVSSQNIMHKKGALFMKKYTRESGIAKAGLLRFCTRICKGLGRVSKTDEVLKGLRFLSERFGHGGIRVMDRGYDANAYIHYFTKETERFIIRVKNNRIVYHNGKSVCFGKNRQMSNG